MAVTNTANQFRYTGANALDAKTAPVNSISDLSSIPVKQRYPGMTIIVLNSVFDEDEELISTSPMECWLVGDVTNPYWRIKSLYPMLTYADLTSATTSILSVFNRMIDKGTEVTVLEDETNDGKPTKYWVTAVDTTAKTVTWEKMGGNVDLTGYATEQWVEDKDYLPKDSIQGNDKE